MRIAFMHRRLSGGGTEADLRRMASGLAARGHDLHVFVADAGDPLRGVHVHRVPVVRAGRVARLLSFALTAPRAATRGRFDVVVGFGRIPRQDVVRIGGGTHRSYLTTMERAGRRGAARGPYHRAIVALERRMFAPEGHRRVLAVSRRVADEVMRDYGVVPERVRVVYNGVDLDRFHPERRNRDGAATRAALGAGSRPVCVAIGTGFVRKGFDRLLACWRAGAPSDAMLVLVGDDERLAQYRRMADGDGAVRVLGPRRDVDALLAAADVLCLPSRQEAFGNVVLEALAAGVPVVITPTVGAGELLDDARAAVLVDDADDPVRLGGAIARAIEDDWPARSRAARRLAEAHPWSRHLDEVEALFAEVARGG